ncbi:MAG: Ig-like domain-containing protein [Calditrichota bacterium]
MLNRPQKYERLTSLLATGLIIIFSSSCRGPLGPSGLNVQGVDVDPPTIVINSPWPLTEVWDTFDISASAVDNVAIREVTFTIDGSSLIGRDVLVFANGPYLAHIDARLLSRGWHFISARAYDTGNNLAEAPVIPIKVGYSSDMQDTTVIVRYNSGIWEKTWTIPDTARTLAFWSRFSIADTCYLRSVSLKIGGVVNDTGGVAIGVWHGSTYPSVRDTVIVLNTVELTPHISDKFVSFGANFRLTREFFIQISLEGALPGDTVRLGADGGDPFWNRSGSRDEDGYRGLKQRFARKDNFIIDCSVYYPGSPNDSIGPQ